MPRCFRHAHNLIWQLGLAILCAACGPVLPETRYPNRHLLAQEQTTQGRYYTLEQAMTDAAAESLGQASLAHQEATQAKKDATDARQLAETLAAGTKELSLSLEELRTSLAELQSRPAATAIPNGNEPLKTFMVVLMRTPDAAMGPDARGPEVRQLNLLLIIAGYLKESTVQEHYTKKTTAAVRALQKDSQLPATGVFDDATARALATQLGATTAPLFIMTGTPHVPVAPNPLLRSEPSAAGPQRTGFPANPAASPKP